MPNVEVSLLNFKFQFKSLAWREEFSIRFAPKIDRLRTILSHALIEVSGLKVNSVKDALRVLEAIPSTVIYRVFIIYKGSLPTPRIFTTTGLYHAPPPNRFVQNIEKAEEERETTTAEQLERSMEARFGRKELEETRATERLVLEKSQGITPPTPDGLESGSPQKPRPDNGLGVRPANKPPSQPKPRPNSTTNEKKYV